MTDDLQTVAMAQNMLAYQPTLAQALRSYSMAALQANQLRMQEERLKSRADKNLRKELEMTQKQVERLEEKEELFPLKKQQIENARDAEIQRQQEAAAANAERNRKNASDDNARIENTRTTEKNRIGAIESDLQTQKVVSSIGDKLKNRITGISKIENMAQLKEQTKAVNDVGTLRESIIDTWQESKKIVVGEDKKLYIEGTNILASDAADGFIRDNKLGNPNAYGDTTTNELIISSNSYEDLFADEKSQVDIDNPLIDPKSGRKRTDRQIADDVTKDYNTNLALHDLQEKQNQQKLQKAKNYELELGEQIIGLQGPKKEETGVTNPFLQSPYLREKRVKFAGEDEADRNIVGFMGDAALGTVGAIGDAAGFVADKTTGAVEAVRGGKERREQRNIMMEEIENIPKEDLILIEGTRPTRREMRKMGREGLLGEYQEQVNINIQAAKDEMDAQQKRIDAEQKRKEEEATQNQQNVATQTSEGETKDKDVTLTKEQLEEDPRGDIDSKQNEMVETVNTLKRYGVDPETLEMSDEEIIAYHDSEKFRERAEIIETLKTEFDFDELIKLDDDELSRRMADLDNDFEGETPPGAPTDPKSRQDALDVLEQLPTPSVDLEDIEQLKELVEPSFEGTRKVAKAGGSLVQQLLSARIKKKGKEVIQDTSPAEAAPVEETTVEETTADETPVEETTVEETPVEEEVKNYTEFTPVLKNEPAMAELKQDLADGKINQSQYDAKLKKLQYSYTVTGYGADGQPVFKYTSPDGKSVNMTSGMTTEAMGYYEKQFEKEFDEDWNTELTKSETKEPYIVKSGDTFGEIAKKLKIDEPKLKELNPQIENYDQLTVGEKINVQ